MSYISRSGGACYDKLSLSDKTYQVQICSSSKYAQFRVRNQETHNKIEYVYKGSEA